MAITFKVSDSSDFELPDEGFYLFQLGQIPEPKIEDDPFWKPGDPERKKIRSNVYLDCTIQQDEDWSGTMVRVYSTSKPGNELGSPSYPTKLRAIVEAILGRKLTDGESVDADDIEYGYFGAVVKHRARQNGGTKAVLEGFAPAKRKGGKRKPEPPKELFADDDFDE